MRALSAGSRKPGLSLSNKSFRSSVYRPVGVNGGGFVGSIGKFCSGSPVIRRTIRNLSGNSPITGLTLRATGLYFFLVASFINIGSSVCLSASVVGEIYALFGGIIVLRGGIESVVLPLICRLLSVVIGRYIESMSVKELL